MIMRHLFKHDDAGTTNSLSNNDIPDDIPKETCKCAMEVHSLNNYIHKQHKQH